MSNLLPLPKPPKGVEYALTVPESVLFADFGFRASCPAVFKRIFGIDYAPKYISIDDGAMSWDYSENDPFNRLLSSKLNPKEVAQKFITTTACTGRQLVRIAQIVSFPIRWSKATFAKDLLEDLNTYWDAYEEHQTSLYTFWNVEKLLTDSLITALNNAGMQEEIEAGLPTFVLPSEPNYFAVEQRDLSILKSRFKDMTEHEKQQVADRHADMFTFLLTPYNLGTPPTGEDVVKRMEHITESISNQNIMLPSDIPEDVARLGQLERELTFWKTERLDAFALADQYAMPMYKALSNLLNLPLKLIFCMTRDELTTAIKGKREVSDETLNQRAEKYCMAIIDGVISFYEPTNNESKGDADTLKEGEIIQGLATSPGVVCGRVRILAPGEENPVLESDEIIVTRMTRPELGVALDVALAYVTDEGGRLCHAAIVSREKKKPCVVATRKATQVLQNGMRIEVDGSKGIVTVL